MFFRIGTCVFFLDEDGNLFVRLSHRTRLLG